MMKKIKKISLIGLMTLALIGCQKEVNSPNGGNNNQEECNADCGTVEGLDVNLNSHTGMMRYDIFIRNNCNSSVLVVKLENYTQDQQEEAWNYIEKHYYQGAEHCFSYGDWN